MKNNTRVNHPPTVVVPADNRPLVAPIHQSVKFTFDDSLETERYLRGGRDGFFYSRSSNPTLRQLELLLAELQGREDCLLTGSGVASIAAALLALCKAGDHVLVFAESYGPTRYLVQQLLGAINGLNSDVPMSLTGKAGVVLLPGNTSNVADRLAPGVWYGRFNGQGDDTHAFGEWYADRP